MGDDNTISVNGITFDGQFFSFKRRLRIISAKIIKPNMDENTPKKKNYIKASNRYCEISQEQLRYGERR